MRKPCIVKPLLTMQGFSIFGPAPGPPFLIFKARWFAYGNRFHWICGQAYANRAGTRAAFSDFQARGSRKETEFISFAGSQARTVPAPGPPFLNFRPGGSRKETEFIGFAGSQARTAPASGPPFLNFRPSGLRTKTEFIGFAGSQARTAPAPGPPFLIFRPGGSRKETEFINFVGSQARTVPAPGAAINTPGEWLP